MGLLGKREARRRQVGTCSHLRPRSSWPDKPGPLLLFQPARVALIITLIASYGNRPRIAVATT